MNAGERSKLIIASPNEALIGSLAGALETILADSCAVNIGEMSFEVVALKKLKLSIGGDGFEGTHSHACDHQDTGT
jgi:hypothetical protein